MTSAENAVRYPRPPQLDQLGTRHAVVEASAGTGKTYLLEHLVVDLILRRGALLEEILVVTFTEKATAELVQRVRAKLEELRDLAPDSAPARQGATLPPERCWTLDEPARARLRAALLSFDRASISTIHGFCQRILSEYAFWQQRLFDEEPVDEAQAFHGAFVEAVRRDLVGDPARARWLETWLGSGKSLELLERWARETHKALGCTHPPRPLAFRPVLDEPALSRLLHALPEISESDPAFRAALKLQKIHHSTAASFMKKAETLSRLARAHREGQPLSLCLAVLDDLRKARFFDIEKLAAIVSASGGPGQFLHAMRILDGVSPLAAAVRAVLPAVAARLEAKKREAGLYDFQDMLTLVARALDGDGPRQRALLTALRARFRFALVDECQDTDEVQWSIFRRIFVEGDGPQVLTLIGDPKQAIYGFRGADVHTYLRARAEIAATGGAEVFLDENFRSTAPLIDAYNAILDDRAPFFRREGGIRYDRPVRCGRAAALTEAGRPAAPVVLLDVQGGAPKLLTWQVKQAVLGAMVNELRGLLDERPLELREGARTVRVGPSDIFVLTRTTRESREVGDALRAAQIPFAFYKQERLYDTVEARETLDLLRAIADPDDRTARARAWITGFFGLSLPELAGCDDLPPTHPLLARLHSWKALADGGHFETLFARIVEESGIVCREVFLRQTERHLTNYLHVLEVLQAEAARSRGTMRELANTLGAYVSGARKPPGEGTDLQRLETDANAVQIMTVHHSKGLEAPVVFLYGGFWPGGVGKQVSVFHDAEGLRTVRVGPAPADEQPLCENESEDEERRVLYVALTRAKGRLYLPRYPAAFKALQGTYSYLNARLDELMGAFTPESTKALFQPVAIPCPGPPPPASPVATAAVLELWTPPPPVLVDDGPFREIAARRAGFHVTSYSAVKKRHGGYVPVDVEDPAADESVDPRTVDAALATDELPRGRLTGSFLHALLEEVPLESLADAPSLETWQARPAVQALFERMRRRHDRRPEHLPHAARLVHTALTAPVALGPTILPGLATATQALREMEFLYPIPEPHHPGQRARSHPLSPPGGERAGERGRSPENQVDAPYRVDRGLVRGYIDLLFEHEGRTYVCDWKGDWLPSWDPATVAPHCERNYDIQARLYTIAALRMLEIRDEEAFTARFGGVLYCFLRGMRPDSPQSGVHFSRPTWTAVLSWEREMLGAGFWGIS